VTAQDNNAENQKKLDMLARQYQTAVNEIRTLEEANTNRVVKEQRFLDEMFAK